MGLPPTQVIIAPCAFLCSERLGEWRATYQVTAGAMRSDDVNNSPAKLPLEIHFSRCEDAPALCDLMRRKANC